MATAINMANPSIQAVPLSSSSTAKFMMISAIPAIIKIFRIKSSHMISHHNHQNDLILTYSFQFVPKVYSLMDIEEELIPFFKSVSNPLMMN